MIHQFQDKKRIIKRKKTTKIIIGFGFFVVLCSLGILTYTGKIFNSIGLPIWKTQKLVTDTASDLGYLVRTKSSVYKDNENLIQENTTLKNSMIDYQILKNENDQLKELLGRTESKQSFILSNILTKPNHSLYDSIIIDVGSNEGIQVGSKVYVDSKMPIGQIVKVYTNTSLVELYSNPDSETEAVIDGSNATVSLVGRGGGNFEMTIPIDLSSEKGVLVTIPGVTSEVLAVIDGVVSSPNEPVKKVILHSPINIQDVKWVEVKK